MVVIDFDTRRLCKIRVGEKALLDDEQRDAIGCEIRLMLDRGYKVLIEKAIQLPERSYMLVTDHLQTTNVKKVPMPDNPDDYTQ